jgi:uncharacterized protein (TIGR02391 family)
LQPETASSQDPQYGKVMLVNLWDHEAAELRTMPLDALALLVLADFDGGWNVRNYFLEARQYHNAIYRQDGVAERIAEAWAWLEAHALIGRHPTQDSSDARMITESGRHALENGLDRLRAGQRLGMELHPLIAGRVRTQFLMGEFELAAFQAMREVEIRVRSLSGFGEDQIGVPLMTMAFNPNEKMRGPLVDSEAERGEQEAVMAIFRGSIGMFKNPSSHRAVDYSDPTFGAEVVLLADLLLRILDRIAERLGKCLAASYRSPLRDLIPRS